MQRLSLTKSPRSLARATLASALLASLSSCTRNVIRLPLSLRHTLGARPGTPYRPERQFSGGITCGHHPWLHARIVHDLNVSTDVETGIETITWTEPLLYKPHEHGFPEMVRDCMPGQCVRRITGPLSDELIWDRIKGQFKPGWEPNRPRPAVQERADSPNPAMETDAKRWRASSPRR